MKYDDIPIEERVKLQQWYYEWSSKLIDQQDEILKNTFKTYTAETLYAMLNYNALLTMKVLDKYQSLLNANPHTLSATIFAVYANIVAALASQILADRYEKEIAPDIDTLSKLMELKDDRT
jgi:hypothetical protein